MHKTDGSQDAVAGEEAPNTTPAKLGVSFDVREASRIAKETIDQVMPNGSFDQKLLDAFSAELERRASDSSEAKSARKNRWSVIGKGQLPCVSGSAPDCIAESIITDSRGSVVAAVPVVTCTTPSLTPQSSFDSTMIGHPAEVVSVPPLGSPFAPTLHAVSVVPATSEQSETSDQTLPLGTPDTAQLEDVPEALVLEVDDPAAFAELDAEIESAFETEFVSPKSLVLEGIEKSSDEYSHKYEKEVAQDKQDKYREATLGKGFVGRIKALGTGLGHVALSLLTAPIKLVDAILPNKLQTTPSIDRIRKLKSYRDEAHTEARAERNALHAAADAGFNCLGVYLKDLPESEFASVDCSTVSKIDEFINNCLTDPKSPHYEAVKLMRTNAAKGATDMFTTKYNTALADESPEKAIVDIKRKSWLYRMLPVKWGGAEKLTGESNKTETSEIVETVPKYGLFSRIRAMINAKKEINRRANEAGSIDPLLPEEPSDTPVKHGFLSKIRAFINPDAELERRANKSGESSSSSEQLHEDEINTQIFNEEKKRLLDYVRTLAANSEIQTEKHGAKKKPVSVFRRAGRAITSAFAATVNTFKPHSVEELEELKMQKENEKSEKSFRSISLGYDAVLQFLEEEYRIDNSGLIQRFTTTDPAFVSFLVMNLLSGNLDYPGADRVKEIREQQLASLPPQPKVLQESVEETNISIGVDGSPSEDPKDNSDAVIAPIEQKNNPQITDSKKKRRAAWLALPLAAVLASAALLYVKGKDWSTALFSSTDTTAETKNRSVGAQPEPIELKPETTPSEQKSAAKPKTEKKTVAKATPSTTTKPISVPKVVSPWSKPKSKTSPVAKTTLPNPKANPVEPGQPKTEKPDVTPSDKSSEVKKPTDVLTEVEKDQLIRKEEARIDAFIHRISLLDERAADQKENMSRSQLRGLNLTWAASQLEKLPGQMKKAETRADMIAVSEMNTELEETLRTSEVLLRAYDLGRAEAPVLKAQKQVEEVKRLANGHSTFTIAYQPKNTGAGIMPPRIYNIDLNMISARLKTIYVHTQPGKDGGPGFKLNGLDASLMRQDAVYYSRDLLPFVVSNLKHNKSRIQFQGEAPQKAPVK